MRSQLLQQPRQEQPQLSRPRLRRKENSLLLPQLLEERLHARLLIQLSSVGAVRK